MIVILKYFFSDFNTLFFQARYIRDTEEAAAAAARGNKGLTGGGAGGKNGTGEGNKKNAGAGGK